jgi:hypothetical protein
LEGVVYYEILILNGYINNKIVDDKIRINNHFKIKLLFFEMVVFVLKNKTIGPNICKYKGRDFDRL